MHRSRSPKLMRIKVAACAALSLALGGELAASAEHQNQVFFYDGGGASASSIGSLLSPQDRGTLKATGDFERGSVWQRYQDYLLSTSRTEPFLVVFTEDSCAALNGGENEEETEEDEAINVVRTGCVEDESWNHKAVDAVARSISKAFSVGLNVVHITHKQLPQAFDLHRVRASPSLMWFPPQSSRRLQRHAHPRTNFLDLSAAAIQSATGTSVPEAAGVDKIITNFVLRSYTQSGLRPPSPTTRSRAPPVLAVEDADDSIAGSIINAIIALSLLGFLGWTAFENQEIVLKIAQSRTTWFILMEGVLYVALSGLLHSIILRVPPFYVHPQFGFYFSHPSGRKQFLVEGLLNGCWSFIISLGLFSIVDVSAHVPSRYVRDEVFRMSLFAIGSSYMMLYVLFSAKYRWL